MLNFLLGEDGPTQQAMVLKGLWVMLAALAYTTQTRAGYRDRTGNQQARALAAGRDSTPDAPLVTPFLAALVRGRHALLLSCPHSLSHVTSPLLPWTAHSDSNSVRELRLYCAKPSCDSLGLYQLCMHRHLKTAGHPASFCLCHLRSHLRPTHPRPCSRPSCSSSFVTQYYEAGVEGMLSLCHSIQEE